MSVPDKKEEREVLTLEPIVHWCPDAVCQGVVLEVRGHAKRVRRWLLRRNGRAFSPFDSAQAAKDFAAEQGYEVKEL